MNRLFIIFFILTFAFSGCVSLGTHQELLKRQAELEKECSQVNKNRSAFEVENRELREKNNRLTAEITQLKKSAELLYNKGMELYQVENYYGALEQFDKLLDRYPADSLAVSANEKIAEINTMASVNYQKTLKSLEGLKDLKAKIDFLEKETGIKFFLAPDLEKLLRKKDGYVNDLKMQDDASKHILIEDDPTQSTRFYRTTRPVIQEIDRNKSFYVEVYIAQHYSGKKTLHLKTQYIGNKWISYDSVTVKAEGVQIEVICKYPDKMANMNNERIYEWSDNELEDDKILKLMKSDPITVRFNGGYKYTFVLDDEQLTSFREILKKYQALK